MTSDTPSSPRPAARAASQPRPFVPEVPAFVATIAAQPVAPALPHTGTAAVAASASAPPATSSPERADLSRVAARAASSVARG